MTDDALPVIPMIRYHPAAHIFVPLEACGEDTIDFVCSEHDWHWTLEGTMRLDLVWPRLMDELRAHIGSHAAPSQSVS